MNLTPEPGRKLLLIGWDAADWKIIHPLLDAGEMPHLERLINGGVMADLATLQPVLSPMLWNSIATGHRAERHGILGFSEVDPETGGVRPVSSLSRRVKALWNILSQFGLRAHVCNWYASHPAEPINGICVSDTYARHFPAPEEPFPLLPGTVHPPEKASVFEELRLRPEEVTPDILRLFVPRAAEVEQEKDRRLGQLARLVAETITVHNAVTHVLEHEPWDFVAAYYPGIDHFSHGFMNFHPPRLDWVPEELYAFYHDVVNSAYRFHDLLLGRLLQLAGPEATVLLLSDHGFHSDHLRPRAIPRVPAGPATQHRRHGILVMAGPGLKQDERIYGAGLLGITPTALALFGLPAGEDMPGRIFAEAFETPPRRERIPSWEEVDGPRPDGRHPEGASYGLDSRENNELLEHFVALGYLEPQAAEDPARAAERTRQEQQWDLAQSHIGAGQPARAAEILLKLVAERPERGDFVLALAECLAQLRYVKEAETLVEALLADRPHWPSAQYLRASLHLLRREFPAAVERLKQAARAGFNSPTLQLQVGYACYRMRRYAAGQEAFARAAELDPHQPLAHLGLAGCALFQGDVATAASHALDAVALRHDLAVGHLALGLALERLDRPRAARDAYQVALSVNPRFGFALWRLGSLLLQDPATAHEGWELLAAARRARSDKRREIQERRKQAVALRQRLATTLQKARPAWRRLDAEERAQQARTDAKSPASAGNAAASHAPPLIVVSGLPRSGTSLMMQMLQAAGAPILTDGERAADEDNPEGYLEWEPIKTLAQHPERIAEAEGKALKVISMLLPALPPDHHYRVLFMTRPIREVAASQRKMLERHGREAPDARRLAGMLNGHLRQTLQGLARGTHFKTLLIPYPGLIRNPQPWIERIVSFLGADALPHPERMAAVIRPELHRHKAASPGASPPKTE